ncbi:hypothetical protein [Microlunatus ginsengisoli]
MPVEPMSPTLRGEGGSRTGGRAPRRLRHQARDAASVAALSLIGSVAIVAGIWAVTAWLG